MSALVENITRMRFIGFYLTVGIMITALVGLSLNGLNFGIDFTGGFITEYSSSEPMKQSEMKTILERNIKGGFILTSAEGGESWTVRQQDAEEGNAASGWLNSVKAELAAKPTPIRIELLDSDYIGSQIGEELTEQGGLAMLTALIMIMLYLTARFEWRFGLGAIVALLHDVVAVLGVFAWSQLEFDLTILAGLLAIIGYSLNDSIIVADRIRELMRQDNGGTLANIIDAAVGSIIIRTLITSGTTLVTIASIWWLAGSPLFGFSIALFVGILVGTLSSICISATLLELMNVEPTHFISERESYGETTDI